MKYTTKGVTILLILLLGVLAILTTSCGLSTTKDIPVLVKPLTMDAYQTKYLLCANEISYYSKAELSVLNEGDTIKYGDNQCVILKIQETD